MTKQVKSKACRIASFQNGSFKRFGYKKGDLPITESISGRLLRLPFYNEMTEEEQIQVIEAITAFRV